jgi:hypothetical protein
MRGFGPSFAYGGIMKRSLGRSIYDTDKAKLIGVADGVSLLRTKAGRYCLYDMASITPVARATAEQWAYSNLPVTVVLEAFGAWSDGIEELRARLPSSLVARLRAKAESNRLSMTDTIEAALTEYLA